MHTMPGTVLNVQGGLASTCSCIPVDDREGPTHPHASAQAPSVQDHSSPSGPHVRGPPNLDSSDPQRALMGSPLFSEPTQTLRGPCGARTIPTGRLHEGNFQMSTPFYGSFQRRTPICLVSSFLCVFFFFFPFFLLSLFYFLLCHSIL